MTMSETITIDFNPSDAFVRDACMSLEHDFGIVSVGEQKLRMRYMRRVIDAIVKASYGGMYQHALNTREVPAPKPLDTDLGWLLKKADSWAARQPDPDAARARIRQAKAAFVAAVNQMINGGE